MRIAVLITLLFASTTLMAAEPVVSGVAKGQRPGPYSFLISAGAKRGQSHCYICETADGPGIVIFARTMSEPLGKLVRGLDELVGDPKKTGLRAWVTFLNEDQFSFDPRLVNWARKESIRNVPLGVYEDLVGPPVYRLNKNADITVMLFVNQKVVHNHAYRVGELNDEAITSILKEVPGIMPPPEAKK